MWYRIFLSVTYGIGSKIYSREGKEVLFFIPAVEMMCVAPYIFSGNSAHISISLIPVHLKSSMGGISQAQDQSV